MGTVPAQPFPFSLEDALVEVVHDKGGFAMETSLGFRVINPQGDLIPLSFFQQTRRDLVSIITVNAIKVLRREPATGSDSSTIDKDLMSPRQVADVQVDRLGEEIALVRGKETVVGFEPSPIPNPPQRFLKVLLGRPSWHRCALPYNLSGSSNKTTHPG